MLKQTHKQASKQTIVKNTMIQEDDGRDYYNNTERRMTNSKGCVHIIKEALTVAESYWLVSEWDYTYAIGQLRSYML